MALIIDNKHTIGDTVYLVTDIDQLPRLILAYKIYKEGEIMYELIQGTITSMHYAFEIATEKTLINT